MSFDPHERLIIDGARMDANIASRVTACTRVRTMDGAASLEVSIHDPDMELFLSDTLTRDGKPPRKQAATGLSLAAWDRFGLARLELDGWSTRLAGVQYALESGELIATWEDEIAAFMRQQTGRLKSSRRDTTRADFIRRLAHQDSRARRFPVHSPQAGQRQPIQPVKDPNKQKGIHAGAGITIKGDKPDAEQRRNLEIILGVSDEVQAGERATIAMLCAAIGESSVRAIPNAGGSNYWGVFQGSKSIFALNDTEGEARCFLKGGKGFQQGGAIALAAKQPDYGPGQIATAVEASGMAPSFYGIYADEAQKILEAWGGVGRLVAIKERFEFVAGGRRDGKTENHWEGARRVGTEISGWRLFADDNELWHETDEHAISYRPRFLLNGSHGRRGLVEQGVTNLSLQADVGLPIAEIVLNVEAARGTIPAGCVFQLDEFGAITGRWLAWEVREDYMAPHDRAEVTLQRPAPTGKEPAPKTRVAQVPTQGVADSGLTYPLAKHGQLIGTPGVGTHSTSAPPNNWQSDNAVDIGVPSGTEVYAVDHGIISDRYGFGEMAEGTSSRFSGIRLHLETSDNVWYYAHLSKLAPNIQPGRGVDPGALLGYSGVANGVAHLHIACERGNPQTLLGL